jgi:hypothetical protein
MRQEMGRLHPRQQGQTDLVESFPMMLARPDSGTGPNQVPGYFL